MIGQNTSRDYPHLVAKWRRREPMTCSEIARFMGLPRSTVDEAHARALRKLRLALREYILEHERERGARA